MHLRSTDSKLSNFCLICLSVLKKKVTNSASAAAPPALNLPCPYRFQYYYKIIKCNL